MSNVLEIIDHLTERQILLSNVEGRLSVNAPKGALTPDLVALLKSNKAKLLTYLGEHEATQSQSIDSVERQVGQLHPVSFAQKRLWFIDHLEGGSSQYNMPFALKVPGHFDLNKAQEALGAIVTRHESLRSVYVEDCGEVYQRIEPPKPFILAQIDLTDFEQTRQQDKLQQLLIEDAAGVFDLSQDLMLRASLVKTSNHSVLLLNLHHIAADGWSIGLLVNEFTAFYRGDDLAPLPLQYVDFSHWQKAFAESGALERQLAYWQKQLADTPALHGLRADFVRPEQKQYHGAVVGGELLADTGAKLQAIARQYDVTPFMLLHGALTLVLSRFGSTEDIIVGTPVAGRVKAEIEGLIGCFVNTLVLRSHCNVETFAQLMAQIKQVNLDALGNQDLPFEQLVEHLDVLRSQAHTPLFQIMFTLNNNQKAKTDDSSMAFEGVAGGGVMAKFDLDINVEINGDDISIDWLYDCALFTEQSITRIADFMTYVLEQIAQDASQSIDTLLQLPSEQNNQLLQRLSHACDVPEPNLYLHQMFEAQATATPNALAVSCGEHSLSYQKLNQDADALAGYLAGIGVGKGALVGVCLDRSTDMVCTLLAVLKTGAAYVPLDPSYPKARIETVCQQSGLSVLLTEQSRCAEFDHLSTVAVVALDNLELQVAIAPLNVNWQDSQNDLAYVIYTSGSSGTPKGVMISHQAIVQFIQSMQKPLSAPLQSNQCWLAVTTIAFDIAGLEIFGPLSFGAHVVINQTQDAYEPGKIAQIIEQFDVNALQATPAFWQMMLDSGWQGKADMTALVGGEALPSRLAGQLPAKVKRLVNCYGPTEATIWSMVHELESQQQQNFDCLTQSLGNYAHVVVNHQGLPAPLGAVGELYIGGNALAVGYLGLAQMTAERFVECDFNGQSQRWYKTGDLAVHLPDGQLKLIGRMDEQVKIRGFRIELEEISENLLQLSDIVAACVVKAKDGQSLLAFVELQKVETQKVESQNVELKNDESPERLQQRLTEHLSRSLPAYMVPGQFVSVTEWPKTNNGKIDKKALLELGSCSVRAYLAPTGELEISLSKLWAEVLDIDSNEISGLDNFFNIGGHSLLAVTLVAHIRKTLNVEVTVKAVFDHPTISALAAYLTGANAAKQHKKIVKRASDVDTAPLSFAQQRLWFFDKLSGGGSQYNMPFAMEIHGRFDCAVAQTALSAIVARHEVLRTVYIEHDGEVMQKVRADVTMHLTVEDLSDLDESAQQQKASYYAEQDRAASFNLTEDLMLRASYLSFAPDKGVLLFNMHHIASDGWSIGILINEFVSFYQALKKAQKAELEPLQIGYADYALWQRETYEGEQLQTQLDYWQANLHELPQVHSLPLDYLRPAIKNFVGKVIQSSIEADLTAKLQVLGQQQGMTLFMLMHGALALALGRSGNSDDVVVGTPVAGRLETDIAPLIGCFINTLVLRSNIDHATVDDYLAHIRQVNLSAMDNQDVPFEFLVERFGAERTTAYTPLFQVFFAMDNTKSGSLSLDGLEFAPMNGGEPVARFDIEVNLVPVDDGYDMTWLYDTALFDDTTIARLQRYFINVLELLAANNTEKLSAIDMLGSVEKHNLLHKFNDNQLDYADNKPLHRLFEYHAQQSPQSIAVRWNNQQMSYGELNEKANHLTAYLQSLGVVPGDRVGLCVARSGELLVGLLAVLKAGAVYLPMDPDYPKARLAHFIDDAQIKLVLSQSDIISQGLLDNCAKVVDLHNEQTLSAIAAMTGANPAAETDSECNAAYIIYTSGSTGKPKGVEVSHQALMAKFAAFDELLPFAQDDVVAALASMAFDISLLELLYPLGKGSAIELIDAQALMDINELSERLQNCTFIHMVPALARRWLDHIVDNESLLEVYKDRLTGFATGGDAVPKTLLKQLFECLPTTQINQFYGPTEAVLFSVCNQLKSVDDLSLGKAIGNVEVYVVDQHNRLTPFGAEGELLLGGPAVANGYLNRAKQTNSVFVTSPIDGAKPSKVYRTGDIVRIDDAGRLSFIGRTDNQVKIRGFRVEPGEVEQRINALSYIKQAVVCALDAPSGDKQLLAYVVAQSEDFSATQLKADLSEVLPHYMIPAFINTLDVFALTANGKIDRKALPQPQFTSIQQDYIAPSTEAQKQLVTIWREVLGQSDEAIGINSNFFDIGGHSLLVSKLVNQINQTLDVDLQVTDVFNHQSLAQMAEVAEHQMLTHQDDLLSAQLEVDNMSDEQVAELLAQLEQQQ